MDMTRPTQTLLLIEDFAPDRELYRRCLLSDAEYSYRLLEADSVEAGLELCRAQMIDAVLLDYSLPDGNGIEFLQALHIQSNGGSPPVVMVTGKGDERLAVQAIKLGAEDYLVKRDLTPELLQLTMRSAIENAHLRQQLRQSNDRFRVSIENMLDCFGIFSAIRDGSGQIIDFRFDYLNAAALASNEMTQADLSKTLCEIFPAHHETGLFADYCRVVETGEPLIKENLIYCDTFGTQYLTRAYDIRANKLGDGMVISWRDVTARKQTELSLQKANEQITTIWESMTDAYVTLDREWRVIYANSAATQVYFQLTGLEPQEFLGKSHWDIFPALVGHEVEQAYRRAVTEQVAVHLEVWYEPTGNWFETHAYPSPEGLGIYFRDISDRRQAELIVQQQLAEIESIYKTAPIGLCFVDTDLKFVRINERLAEINGFSISDHLGRTLREILPDLADQLEPLYRQVIESGEPILNLEVEGTNCAQPGVLRQWLVCYYPQQDMHQRVMGVNVMVQEITERKQFEANLARTTEILHSVIEGSSDVIFVKDLQGRYVVANSTAATWLDTTPETMLGQDDTALFPPEMAQQIQQTDRQVMQTGESIVFEEDVPKQDVSRSLLSAKYPWRDGDGKILGVIGISRDISDRKQTEAEREQMQIALRESEEQLRFTADTIPHIVWVTDPYGVTTYVNQRWVEYTGLSLAAALDYGWQNLLHPDDLPRVQAFWTEACQTASVYDIKYRLRCADGMFRWQLVRGRPMRDQQGRVVKWFGTCTDIHDQKQAELERDQLLADAQAARAEAEAANRSKDEFVAMVAHELRSPLNSIAGWSKLLQTRKFDDATLSKALDTIYRNTQAQVQLVEDLLDISRMVKGTLQIQTAPVNWVNVIEAALDLVRPMADAKHIQLKPDLTLTPQVSGDFNRLQQIAVNLLTNAIKFTPPSGRVEVQLEQVDAQVVLRVHDTGKGIAPEFLPYIFERYQQGQQNTGSKDGLGLGLAIVKNLVELHNGTIAAESAGIGQGSTFTVRLPRLETLAIPQDSSVVVGAISLVGIRVLAVEDELDMLNLIAFVLQDYGAEVKAVTTAAAALQCLSQFKPNILLSDIAMPGGNGYELVQQVKLHPEGQIPAIALTAYASATDREQSRLAGFQQHLSKPVDPEDLVAAILSLVRGETT
jgi:PAS domain S-box-containing protein